MSAAGNPGYKETSIGWIPQDWETCQLGELCTLITKGTTPTTVGFAYQKSGINFIKVESIDGYGNINLEKAARISEEAHNALNRSKLQMGDILYSIAGAIGRSAIVRKRHLPANTNQALAIIRPKGAIDTTYLRFVLSSEAQLNHISQISVSSAQANISLKDVSSFSVPFPTRPEQQKIAAILTAVDDKLDVIARQIEATRTLKQGLMKTLFSRGVGTQDADGRWVPHVEFKESELGEIPVGWAVAPLGELIEKLMDFRGRTPKKIGMDWGGGVIPALSANNVRMGYIDFDRECYLGSDELYAAWMVQGDTRKNDLVFTMEAPLGNVAVIPDDRKYILSQRVVLLRVNQRVKHSYLFQYLRSDTFGKILDSNSTGTTAKGIQQKRLVQLPIVVPPQEEQGRIADMLGVIDSKLDALLAKQSQHQTLKRGLMQKLLTGEWRVSVDASATGT